MSSLREALKSSTTIKVEQRRELAELIGFETRNKYALIDEAGRNVGFVAEQQKGWMGFLFRQFLGHWRTFEVIIFDNDGKPVLRANHPFRWFFQRFEVRDAQTSELLGSIQQRWAFFSKRFDVEGSLGELLMKVDSPFFKFWTFAFTIAGIERGRVEKQWSGLIREAFTDADKFKITFTDPDLPERERLLLVAASVFIDLQYFERKARSGGSGVASIFD